MAGRRRRIDANPLLGVKPPKLDSKVIDALTDEQFRLLIKACAGKDLIDRRDEAIVRLMTETGLRAGEVLGMHVDDVDLAEGRAVVRRGKGGKGRVVPFGPQTAAAIDRYMRARRTHRFSSTEALWLGGGGEVQVPRAGHGAEASRPGRRYPGFPSAPDAAYRGDPLAARRRL